jgi:hypothetical protein
VKHVELFLERVPKQQQIIRAEIEWLSRNQKLFPWKKKEFQAA